MKKGSSMLVITILSAVILLFFGVAVVSAGFTKAETEPLPESPKTMCINDCKDNPVGTRCMDLFDEGVYKSSFCGCLISADCPLINDMGGICGVDNKCE